jgi:hypothetical protein
LLLLVALSANAQERFQLQSNFWVSLHQTLLDAGQNNRLVVADGLMRDAERSIWNAAVLTYRARYTDRMPFLDDELIRINDALSTAGEAIPAGFPEEITKALATSSVVYRKYFWTDDDRVNRFWITTVEGLLRDAGEELAKEHARVYGVPFPARVRVDVAPRAGPFGAYTSDHNGVHTVISSRDPSYQGFAALEMLLHEASHAIVGPASGQIGPEINQKAVEKRLLAPRQLWHAVIFYTSGELTRRALKARGVDYTPYAYKQNMWERTFNGLREPLETFWQSYLEGKATRDVALDNIVGVTGIAPPPRNAAP